jgi:DNA/RNA-binding domain of Phe-tRNA-synthetase-like protein
MYTTANIPKLFGNKSTSSSPTTADRYTIDSLKLMPAIQATRAAYKACGKDPSRYRPSSEALIRRTLRGMELYKVDTLVDAVNLASIAYGYSIGGFDADKIQGDTLTLGIGRAGEPYEGIGRGPLNIEGLPVYRDQIGGIGTPTSDHERTKLSLSTTRLLAVVNGYGGGEFLDDTITLLQSLLREYAASDGGTVLHF